MVRDRVLVVVGLLERGEVVLPVVVAATSVVVRGQALRLSARQVRPGVLLALRPLHRHALLGAFRGRVRGASEGLLLARCQRGATKRGSIADRCGLPPAADRVQPVQEVQADQAADLLAPDRRQLKDVSPLGAVIPVESIPPRIC